MLASHCTSIAAPPRRNIQAHPSILVHPYPSIILSIAASMGTPERRVAALCCEQLVLDVSITCGICRRPLAAVRGQPPPVSLYL